jgi:hypothetical protein
MSQGKITEKKNAQYLLHRSLSIRLYRTMILPIATHTLNQGRARCGSGSEEGTRWVVRIDGDGSDEDGGRNEVAADAR